MSFQQEASDSARSDGEIAIITVQYNNFGDTQILARSLAQLEANEECELIVVDNSEQSPTRSAPDSPSDTLPYPARFLKPVRNLFYWGGAAYAIEHLQQNMGGMPQWTIVCNNDITIEDPRFLTRLRSLDPIRYPIIAPAITSVTTGRQQNPMLRSPAGSLKRLKWRTYDLDYRVAKTMLGVHAALKRLVKPFGRMPASRQLPSSREVIYAPHGACMIFSRSFFERGGRLDTTVPMFAEELTVAALAQRLQLPVWYCPELTVMHREHSTTGHRLNRTKYEMERLARKHYFALTRQ